MIYCSRCRASVCAKSGHFTTVPCLNRKSMHHSVREGGSNPKSLPSVQSPGPQTNKDDIKNLQPREGRKLPPLGCPRSLSSKVSGDAPWRLDKACPIVTLSMPTFSPPVPPNHLSATQSKYRKGTQRGWGGREGTECARPGENRTPEKPQGPRVGTRSGALQEIV